MSHLINSSMVVRALLSVTAARSPHSRSPALSTRPIWLTRPPIPRTPATADGQFQEVVVTANKRAEDTKDVPLSVGVVSGAELTDLHVDSVEDISRLVPGISFAAHNNGPNGPGQDNITIRGVSSTVGNPTVGIYIDEMPLITITGYEGDSEPRLIDIDRVEVLRGPQGTLYGACSEGGTVRYITPNRTPRTTAAGSGRSSPTPRMAASTTTPRACSTSRLSPTSSRCAYRPSMARTAATSTAYALQGSLAAGTATAGPCCVTDVNGADNKSVSIKGLYTPGRDLVDHAGGALPALPLTGGRLHLHSRRGSVQHLQPGPAPTPIRCSCPA